MLLQSEAARCCPRPLTDTQRFSVFCAVLSRIQLSAAPWTVARQAPLSMVFSRQEHRSGEPFPSPSLLILPLLITCLWALQHFFHLHLLLYICPSMRFCCQCFVEALFFLTHPHVHGTPSAGAWRAVGAQDCQEDKRVLWSRLDMPAADSS